MIKTILFDLDGTLLPMDQDHFVETYFGYLAARFARKGYDPKKLIEVVWNGVKVMVMNNGSQSNEQAFWKYYSDVFGAEAAKEDHPEFNDFYEHDFPRAQSSCGFQKQAAPLVQRAKEAGYRVVLATNPIFPEIATRHRIHWAGLEFEDFEFVTTYENSSFSKPNPEYYRNLLEKIGCEPGQCLMVGNDVDEDMVAQTLGIQVFLLTDCMINANNRDISSYPQGGFSALADYLGLSI